MTPPTRKAPRRAAAMLAALLACALAANAAEAPGTGAGGEAARSASAAAAPAAPGVSAKSPVKRASGAVVSDYASREEVRAWLEALSRDKAIPLEWLLDAAAVARYSPLSEKYTTPRPNAPRKTTPERNFLLYERNLVNAERIDKGAAFLRRHRAVFDRVEAETGVPRHIIAAIIGIESIYGKNMGRFRVLDALMTLSFDYTRRAPYYRAELANFLEFCWSERIEPVSVTGSFAGAMGLGQFMPASLKAFGRDGDGDGRVDIVGSEPDGIASVASFLAGNGWVPGERPLYRVEANDEIFRGTGSGGIAAHTTVGALLAAGVKPVEPLPLSEDEPALLVDLPWTKASGAHGTDYFIGTRSFSAILRYNRSYFYAAAVTRLAERLGLAQAAQPEDAARPSAAPAEAPAEKKDEAAAPETPPRD